MCQKIVVTHYFLFPKKLWSSGTLKFLRDVFTAYVRDDKHVEFHSLVDEIKLPFDIEKICEKAEQEGFILQYSSFDNNIKWLLSNTKDEEFKQYMRFQYKFFSGKDI